MRRPYLQNSIASTPRVPKKLQQMCVLNTLFFYLLVLSPSDLLAQVDNTVDGTVSNLLDAFTLTLTPSSQTLNINNCEDVAENTEFTLNGEYTTPSTSSYYVRLIATTGTSCGQEDVCNETPLDEGGCSCLKELSDSSSVSVSFTINDLFDVPCEMSEEKTISFFMHYTTEDLLTGNSVEEESTAVKITVDLNAPSAPSTAPTVNSAEEALLITLPEVGGDATEYEVCVREEGSASEDSDEYTDCRSAKIDEPYRFEGLVNDTTYEVIYAVYDDSTNRSENSPSTLGTPVSVLDFAEVYSGEYPGGERGGCQTGPPSPLSLVTLLSVLLFLPLIFGRRRQVMNIRRLSRFKELFGVLLSLMITGGAWELAVASPWSAGTSDRNTTITIQGGSYQPNIDQEFEDRQGVERPYEKIFQNDSPLMLTFIIERHILQRWGTLSVGGSFSYWNVEGKGLSADVTETNDNTEMSMRPLSLHVNYRMDHFQSSLPIVPFIKGGLSYYLWTIYDGGGDTARFVSGEEATGGTLGWYYSVGAQFLLDFLDSEMAWAFDRDAGVNHSYLTFEYQVSQIDDFGDPDSFRLGNESFFFGIALDL